METPARLKWGIVAVAGIVAVGAFLVVADLTDQPRFCASCHEMTPYYRAWLAGRHGGRVACVECHVDPGVGSRLAHKAVALREVWDHFTTHPKFPRGDVAIPNRRCARCHAKRIERPDPRFSHAQHTKLARCQECHSTTGHRATLETLAAAGLLTPGAVRTAAGAVTASSMAGHARLSCFKCHDPRRTPCDTCHVAPHRPMGSSCTTCHQAGAAWAFAHPAGSDCTVCHRAPPGHFGSACSSCHTARVPFAQATFQHPSVRGDHTYRSFPCAACHPNGFATYTCTRCHGPNGPGD